MNFKRSAALLASSTLVLGLAGCGSNFASAPGMTKRGLAYNAAAKRRAEKGGKWAILVHLAAENNLYRFALEDLNEMEAGIPTDGSVDVYVFFDGIKNGDSCVYKIKRDSGMNGNIISEKIPVPFIPASNEVDSGDPKVVAAFVDWAGKNVKADHTMISFWDHGSGIFHGAPNPITKGFGWDDNGTNLETSDLTLIGNTFRAAAGKGFDILGFDACLMAHGEIAYQVKGNADYLVASEELEPGAGWDYKGWLTAVGKLAEKTPAAVGSALVDTYHASYQPGGSQSSGRDDTTLSLVDVNALTANVVPALNEFVTSAVAAMGSEKAALQGARSKAQTFYNRDCADLGSFLGNVKASTRDKALSAATSKLDAAYRSAIVREAHSADNAGATGLVLYFPTPTQSINGSYGDPAKIAFADTAWGKFLKAYR
ncbi:MAG: clostripain-related cysteine peptidase [Candidatus Sericytochromatia bacterium]|nr:clostripain-related cysteine peptidase [Candidatus Sericytochromatia bacterium]